MLFFAANPVFWSLAKEAKEGNVTPARAGLPQIIAASEVSTQASPPAIFGSRLITVTAQVAAAS